MRRTALAVLLWAATAVSVSAANPSMSDDFGRMMDWLTTETATGLSFNAGSTFDPPTEMRPWRMQPDLSLGVGHLPFDKSTFPTIQVKALAEKDPGSALPDKMMFPNLTLHMRLGLPGRMDLGLRLANMTTPKNYQLSEDTTGNGQSNTIGIGLRRHFMGGRRPMVTVSGNVQRVSGYFNYVNKFENVELVPNMLTASSVNSGQLEWDVTTVGVNMVVSQAYGRWIPFLGAGFNRSHGAVRGRLEAVWQTPLISPSLGEASSRPEPTNARLIFGTQRQCAFFNYFINGEVKTMGKSAGKTFIISTGLAAPFKVGANSSVVRFGKEGRENSRLAEYADRQEEFRKPKVVRYGRNKPAGWEKTAASEESLGMRSGPTTMREERLERYWTWNEQKKPKPRTKKKVTLKEREQPELIFIR